MRYLLGNVKKDGKLSFEDLMIVQSIVLDLENYDNTKYLTPEDYIIADVNKDGKVNTIDILSMQTYIIGRRYTPNAYQTINIERGNTIVESLPVPPIHSKIKISDKFSLKENCAYGLRFNFDFGGRSKRVFGTYASNIKIPALNNNEYIGFFVQTVRSEVYGDPDLDIYIYQDADGIYLLRYLYTSEWDESTGKFVYEYNFDILSTGNFKIEDFYEINTSE